MRKLLLDFCVTKNREQVQDYLALVFEFPDYYGKNLDALYDMLTENQEDICVGVFGLGERSDRSEDLTRYLKRVRQVFWDAQEENPHLCVIFENFEDNFEGNEGELL
ncbi:MAG: barstar family protein [Lachnospiraceae bacterium]|nr:barstar family protein [Lachnospiraceae bacterium]